METETETTPLENLVAKLQQLRPVPRELRVTLGDGETRKLTVASARRRWQMLRRVLEPLDWLRVEAFDAKGAFLGAFDSGAELGEVDGDIAELDAADARIYAMVAKLVKLNQESVRDARAHESAQSKDLMAGAAQCVRTMSESVGSLHRLYETRLKVLDAMLGDTDGDSNGDGDGLMSSKMLALIGPEVAKALAPEIAKVVAAAMGGAKH